MGKVYPKISNLKISWKIRKVLLGKKFFRSLHTSSHILILPQIKATVRFIPGSGFWIIKIIENEKTNVFPIFTIFRCGHINCTKIKNRAAIRHCMKLFYVILLHIIKQKKILIKPFICTNIDNISAFGDVGQTLLLKNTYHPPVDELMCKIKFHYNPERFPCLYIKFEKKLGGCIGLYANGKVTFVGAKSEKHLRWMWDFVVNVVNRSQQVII